LSSDVGVVGGLKGGNFVVYLFSRGVGIIAFAMEDFVSDELLNLSKGVLMSSED